ncbi:MAG: o-succinylbenzoate synthase [Synechococcus sp.]|nr:o-succinylbenzoate synthase [Synechococcus sp.]
MAPLSAAAPLRCHWRSFRLPLPRPLRTARGTLAQKRGWLLRLEAPGTSPVIGWGEAAPLEAGEAEAVGALLADWEAGGPPAATQELEALLPLLPPSLAFACGAALAELAGQPAGGWRAAPPSAHLLPAGEEAIACLERRLLCSPEAPLTMKWKVAAGDDRQERAVLERLLQRLPATARLRLDANGGWSRATAAAWAERLAGEPRLAWLEQPLDPADVEGLEALARRVPVALDESLQRHPALRARWPSWQVRRPSQEGDPRPLLARLEAQARLGVAAPAAPELAHLVFSTAFETGIGHRWIAHLAALQAQGPAPVVPGLAPGWRAAGALSSPDPHQVWEAARPEGCPP